ncbi:hypothetical protein CBM2626_B30107 [Cupriavidus taiwanensis]|nr:hypothetical protein CBM2626_B30107 [Cupriavidus taiwanensis]
MASNFVSLRYPYERYDKLSESEYHAFGRDWVESGASLEDATSATTPKNCLDLRDSPRFGRS